MTNIYDRYIHIAINNDAAYQYLHNTTLNQSLSEALFNTATVTGVRSTQRSTPVRKMRRFEKISLPFETSSDLKKDNRHLFDSRGTSLVGIRNDGDFFALRNGNTPTVTNDTDCDRYVATLLHPISDMAAVVGEDHCLYWYDEPTANLYDSSKKRLYHSLFQHPVLEWCALDNRVLAIGAAQAVRLFDMSAPQVVQTFTTQSAVKKIAIHEQFIATLGMDGRLTIFDQKMQKSIYYMPKVVAIDWHPTMYQTLTVVNDTNKFQNISCTETKCVAPTADRLTDFNANIVDFCWLQTGREMFVSSNDKGTCSAHHYVQSLQQLLETTQTEFKKNILSSRFDRTDDIMFVATEDEITQLQLDCKKCDIVEPCLSKLKNVTIR